MNEILRCASVLGMLLMLLSACAVSTEPRRTADGSAYQPLPESVSYTHDDGITYNVFFKGLSDFNEDGYGIIVTQNIQFRTFEQAKVGRDSLLDAALAFHNEMVCDKLFSPRKSAPSSDKNQPEVQEKFGGLQFLIECK